MLRVLLAFLFGCVISTSVHSQQPFPQPKIPLLAEGDYCCTVTGVKDILYEGEIISDYKDFCCAYSSQPAASRCAKDRMIAEGYTLDREYSCVVDCDDTSCPYMTRVEFYSVPVKASYSVRLLCYGCDGRKFTITASGENCCIACNRARLRACETGSLRYGGLRCYRVIPIASAQPQIIQPSMPICR